MKFYYYACYLCKRIEKVTFACARLQHDHVFTPRVSFNMWEICGVSQQNCQLRKFDTRQEAKAHIKRYGRRKKKGEELV